MYKMNEKTDQNVKYKSDKTKWKDQHQVTCFEICMTIMVPTLLMADKISALALEDNTSVSTDYRNMTQICIESFRRISS